MSSQEVVQRTPAQEIVAQVRGPVFLEQVALALPSNVPASRFVRAAVTALNANAELAEADPSSLMQSLLRAAQDGLLPDGREAAILIFNTKVKVNGTDTWVKKAQYLPMIGGYRKIAAEHGWAIKTAVVYANDDFEHELGLEERLVHRPVRPGEERGEVVAAYAVGVERGPGGTVGQKLIEVMSKADIEKARAISKAKDGPAWKGWYERMCEKTVGKRLFQKLPLGELDNARIKRLLTADELGPGEAAAALYGTQDRKALEAGSTVATTPPAVEPEGELAAPHPVAEAPSQEPEATSDEDVASASSSEQRPEFDGEEPGAPDAEAEPEPQVDDAVVAAGEVEFTSGRCKGHTIRQVHEELKDPGYIVWTAKNWQSEPLRSAAITYVEAHGLS